MAAIFGDPNKPIFSGSDVLPHVKNMFYPLVNVYITMENNHFSGENRLYMGMFNSYVKLPEGNMGFMQFLSGHVCMFVIDCRC